MGNDEFPILEMFGAFGGLEYHAKEIEEDLGPDAKRAMDMIVDYINDNPNALRPKKGPQKPGDPSAPPQSNAAQSPPAPKASATKLSAAQHPKATSNRPADETSVSSSPKGQKSKRPKRRKNQVNVWI